MRGSTRHRIRPLQRGASRPATVEHDEFTATEYELYIPSGIWTHSAVERFLAEPLHAEGGATISKGATGIWRGGQEETHVIRIVIRHAERDRGSPFFDLLQRRAGHLMARLAEWPEARQHEVMFTAKEVRVSVSRLKRRGAPPPGAAARRRPRKRPAP